MSSVQELLAAARREGLDLTTDQPELDQSGLDFEVCHARDADGVAWIVRAPRRQSVVDAAVVEARTLRLVAPRLPVRVPDWRVHAPDVIAYPRLAGTTAVTISGLGAATWNIIDPAAPSDVFVDSFADALAALLTIDPEEARAAGVPATTIADVRRELAEAVAETRAALAPPDALVARWQRWLDDDASWPAHAALVHGDLHPGHMLLDDTGRLIAVLDWTEAKVTDPSVDVAMFLFAFGEAATRGLIDRLARRGAPTWDRMASHAAERLSIFPVLGAQWALRHDNPAILEYARSQLA